MPPKRLSLKVCQDSEPCAAARNHRSDNCRGASIQHAFDTTLRKAIQLLLCRQIVEIDGRVPLAVGCIKSAVPCVVRGLFGLVWVFQGLYGMLPCLLCALLGLERHGGQLGWIGQEVGHALCLGCLLLHPIHSGQSTVVASLRAARKGTVVLSVKHGHTILLALRILAKAYATSGGITVYGLADWNRHLLHFGSQLPTVLDDVDVA